jgi:hypothetical protein
MSQPPIPFSSSFNSLTLNVTTGNPPNQVTHTQAITPVFQGNNSVPITDANILNAFNSQAVGTSFTPSIVAEFGNALSTVSTPSVASFMPRVISLADIPNKLTTDAPFNLLIDTVSDGVLSYSSSVTSVAPCDSSGQVTLVGAGTTTITVTQAATANHPAASASRTFTVSLPTSDIVLGVGDPNPILPTLNNFVFTFTIGFPQADFLVSHFNAAGNPITTPVPGGFTVQRISVNPSVGFSAGNPRGFVFLNAPRSVVLSMRILLCGSGGRRGAPTPPNDFFPSMGGNGGGGGVTEANVTFTSGSSFSWSIGGSSNTTLGTDQGTFSATNGGSGGSFTNPSTPNGGNGGSGGGGATVTIYGSRAGAGGSGVVGQGSHGTAGFPFPPYFRGDGGGAGATSFNTRSVGRLSDILPPSQRYGAGGNTFTLQDSAFGRGESWGFDNTGQNGCIIVRYPSFR